MGYRNTDLGSLLPELTTILSIARDPAWRAFAVEDLIALLILEYGVGHDGLDAAAMVARRGFRRRAQVDVKMVPTVLRRRIAAYLEAYPIPQTLMIAAGPTLARLRARKSLVVGAEAPKHDREFESWWLRTESA